MPTQIFTISILGGDINASLQVGDAAYYSPLSTVAGSGFSTVTTGNIKKLGDISVIDKSAGSISILIDKKLDLFSSKVNNS